MQLRALLAGRPTLDADEVSRRCALAQAASAATRHGREGERRALDPRLPRAESRLDGRGHPRRQRRAERWQAYIPELGLETKLRLGPDRNLDEPGRSRGSREPMSRPSSPPSTRPDREKTAAHPFVSLTAAGYPFILWPTMEQKDYRLAAIMYTDIAGFSRMMERDEVGHPRAPHLP
jgi:hypothetical protein